MRSIVCAINSANGFGGDVGVCSITASILTGRFTSSAGGVMEIREVEQPGWVGSIGGPGWSVAGSPPPAIEWNMYFSSGSMEAHTASANANSIEIPRTDLTSSKNFITTQFSAPGGPEVNSRGYLDVATGQYSVYNSLNYRNLAVRGSGSGEFHSGSCQGWQWVGHGSNQQEPQPVAYASGSGPNWETIRVQSNIGKLEGQRTLLARHCGKGGMDSTWGSLNFLDSGSYIPKPATYKQHRNTLMRPKIVDTRLRNAISRPTHTLAVGAGIMNSELAGYNRNDGLSFSFLLYKEIGSGGYYRTIIVAKERPNPANPASTLAEAIEVKVSDSGGLGILQIDCYRRPPQGWFRAYFRFQGNYSEWSGPLMYQWVNVVIAWDKADDLKVYYNGIQRVEFASRVYSGDTDYLPGGEVGLNMIRLFDDGTNQDLLGSMMNFAIWKSFLTLDQARELSRTNSEAPGLDIAQSTLGDYWTLGKEATTINLGVGAEIASGSILLSDIGKNHLVVATDGYYIAAGAYPYNIATDAPQYNNMNVTSMIPQSDFQYSWINNTISGSTGWMREQKVRGYAPKTGELLVKGGGTFGFISAITFPTASQLYGDY